MCCNNNETQIFDTEANKTKTKITATDTQHYVQAATAMRTLTYLGRQKRQVKNTRNNNLL